MPSPDSPASAEVPPPLPVAPGEPLHPAGLGWRVLAFAMDVILLTAALFLLLFRLFLPAAYPEEWIRFQEWSQRYWAEAARPNHPASLPDITTLDSPTQNMLISAQNFLLLGFWIYFAAAETFYSGRTLGKRMFRLRVGHIHGGRPLELLPAMSRALLKTFPLFLLFPLLLPSYFAAFFDRRHRAGHDWATFSLVFEDNAP